jgi:hypothetical protein
MQPGAECTAGKPSCLGTPERTETYHIHATCAPDDVHTRMRTPTKTTSLLFDYPSMTDPSEYYAYPCNPSAPTHAHSLQVATEFETAKRL